jgi:diguanylate cyclase
LARQDTEITEKKSTAILGEEVRVRDVSYKAMQRIEELNLDPVPHVYELWFRYFQGDPEIVRAIDTYPSPLDEISCLKIYKRYLSETARSDAVKKISEQMQQAIAELADTLKSAKSATTEYGDTLQDVSRKMEDAETLEDFGAAVSNIVQNTRRMVQKNKDLEFQLTNASTQVTDLKKSLDNVKKESLTDSLTGLANRKAFDRQIQEWVDEVNAHGGKLCLLMLDIDHFKSFNDNHGHLVGDQVLRLVARALTDGVKGRDFAARFGGEEFAILFLATPLAEALKEADSLRKAVENREVVNKTSNKSFGRITLSAGITEYAPGEEIVDFIGRADAALYNAKKSGRNRVSAATHR